jgi:hypothetical protein
MFSHTILTAAGLAVAATSFALAETAAERKACFPDAQANCSDVFPDRDKVYECLVKKIDTLSAPCKKIVENAMATNRRK